MLIFGSHASNIAERKRRPLSVRRNYDKPVWSYRHFLRTVSTFLAYVPSFNLGFRFLRHDPMALWLDIMYLLLQYASYTYAVINHNLTLPSPQLVTTNIPPVGTPQWLKIQFFIIITLKTSTVLEFLACALPYLTLGCCCINMTSEMHTVSTRRINAHAVRNDVNYNFLLKAQIFVLWRKRA